VHTGSGRDSEGGECTFVSPLFQLSVVAGLLDDVEDFLREGFVGDGPGCGGVVFGHCLSIHWARASVDVCEVDGG
jgi:hypothetical protein